MYGKVRLKLTLNLCTCEAKFSLWLELSMEGAVNTTARLYVTVKTQQQQVTSDHVGTQSDQKHYSLTSAWFSANIPSNSIKLCLVKVQSALEYDKLNWGTVSARVLITSMCHSTHADSWHETPSPSQTTTAIAPHTTTINFNKSAHRTQL